VVNFHTKEETEVQIFMLYILVPLIFLNFIRNLKLLAPFSTLANIITVAGFVITLYYLLRNGLKDAGDRHMVGTWEGIPLFFGTVLFALEAIGVVSTNLVLYPVTRFSPAKNECMSEIT